MPLLSRQTFLGWAKESTMGTPVAATLFIPFLSFKPRDIPSYVMDESIAAQTTALRGEYQAEWDSTVEFECYLFPELVGPFLVAAGFADVVTGPVGGVYTHTLKLPANFNNPPKITISDFDGVETRQFPGQVLDELTLKIDRRGAIKATVKMKGWKSVTASNPTFAPPASASFLAWETAATIAGSATSRLVSAEYTIKRNSQTEHTLQGLQNPYSSFAGKLQVAAKVKSLFESNTELNHSLLNDQPTMSLVVTAPGGGTNPVFTISTQKTAWKNPQLDRSGEYISLDTEVDCISNATDGPATNPAAASFIIANATATTY